MKKQDQIAELQKVKQENIQDIKEKKKNELLSHLIQFVDYGSMADHFIERQPLFYDKNGVFWLWDNENKCWEITDDIDLMNLVDAVIGGIYGRAGTYSSSIKNMILESLKRKGRLKIPLSSPKS